MDMLMAAAATQARSNGLCDCGVTYSSTQQFRGFRGRGFPHSWTCHTEIKVRQKVHLWHASELGAGYTCAVYRRVYLYILIYQEV